MQLETIRYDESFLKEEIRNDYLVTTEFKKLWLVEMDLLQKLINVCDKYGIKYFIEGGTLIGAIRHKGFIPWDDDIDVMMPRSEYNKLLEVAEKEFTGIYFFQTHDTDKGYYRPHAQLRNSTTTAYGKDDIGKAYNRGIFIDIFPADNVNPDKDLYRKQVKKIMQLRKLTGGYALKMGKEHSLKFNLFLLCCKILKLFYTPEKLYQRSYKEFTRYNNVESEKYAYMIFTDGSSKFEMNKKYFEKSIKVPFEFLEVNAPIGYDAFLRNYFGDYMQPVKAPSMHGELVFDTEVDYQTYFKNKGAL